MINSIIAKAEYMIALDSNNITDEIRDNYINNINILEEGKNIFELLVEYTLKALEKNIIFPNEALELIQNEYQKLNLSDVLGDFNIYIDFINFLIDIKITTNKNISLDILKELIAIADTLPELLKVPVYLNVLRNLTNSQKVIEDLEFSQKVIDYVKNANPNIENEYFNNIIHKILNSSNFNQ